MKAKRFLSAIMSAVMVFTMFFALTLVINTAAPLTASADPSATATTKAIYVGPSTRYANNVPSGIFLPIPNLGKYSDGTTAEITAKVKMLSGEKPFVQMMRTATNGKDSYVSASTGSVVFYQADGISSNWHDNSTSNIDSDGIFHCDIKFKDIPGTGNCFYSSVWDGGTEYRKSNISGRSTPIGCGIFIGNTVFEDDLSLRDGRNDLSMEFIISDIHVTLKSISGGDGSVSTGYDLAPSDATLNTAARYFFVGDSKMGNRPDAKNHPLNGRIDQWNICSQDEDTVRQVTVADDIFDGGSHSYTKHNETDYEFEYYTSADFGSDVKFEKIGNCYSRYLDDDVAKKAFIIKSHAGDSKELTSNQGSSTVANIVIPINIHKFYSAYNADTCGSADLREDGTAVRFGISFKARRVSGTGQPVVGVSYADGNANGASGSDYKDAEFGAPREYGKDRSYNNGLEKEGSRTKQSDWVSSSYNASTGEFTALISTESGYYKQMSRDGKTAYISIGLAEHLNSSLEALNTDSTFVISDIKFTVYELNNSSTVKFSGANQAPKMSKANCDVETPYQYTQLWDYNEKVNGTINVGVRHAPLNKYSVDGAIQNVFIINNNVCNCNACSLTHHAATDTTREYWSCDTHNINYSDEFASKAIDSVSATKKMIVIGTSDDKIAGAFIPLDNDGWTGDKYFIFKCKMKLTEGSQLPYIIGFRAGYWGSIGTFYPGDRTSNVAKDGVVTKWVDYDPTTCTYTAAFYMWRADPKSYNQFKYYNSTNGAHTAIMIGNYIPTSGQNPGVTDTAYDTAFAFTDPEIYEAVDAAAGTYTGENLCAPITDKTVDFANNYKYSGCTQLNGSGEWTDRANGTIMNAPIKTWSKSDISGIVSLADIPNGFFDGETPPEPGAPKMLKMAGYKDSSSAQAIIYDTVLDSSTTYQFDMDCRAFGGVYVPRILLQDKQNGGSFTTVSGGELDSAASFNGYHYTAQFTTRSDLNSSGNNFRLQIGLAWNARSLSSMYIANVKIRKVLGGDSFGDNILQNGDFSYSTVGAVTAENVASQMLYWNGYGNLTKYQDVKIMAIPTGFFDSADTAMTGRDDIAIKVDNSDWTELQFKTELKADTYYRLSFNYREMLSMPDLEFNNSNVTATKISSKTGGKYVMTYEIYANSSVTKDSGKDPNTRFRFRFKDLFDRTLYINHVELYELDGTGGNAIGVNIMGNLNAIYDDSIYSELVNDKDSVSVTVDQSGENAVARDLANGWFGSRYGNNNETVRLVKVPSGFFNCKTAEARLTMARQATLELDECDGFDPFFNPNGDEVWGDAMDYMHAKNDVIAEAAE